MFWGDEIMGSYVLRSGSWHRFLELWRGGVDSSGFWFYAFAKPWEWVFGASALRLRMFSAAGIAVSAALIWSAARRFYSRQVVAIAVALPYLDLTVLRWQLANARCYGMLMASTAFVIYLIVRGAEEAHRRPGVRFLLASFFAYDLLAGSHILGILFALTLLGLQIAVDLRGRRLRPQLYASAAVGIGAILLFSLQNIRSTIALGKPVFWTAKPLYRALYFASDVTSGNLLWLVIFLFTATFLFLRRRASRDVIYLILLAFLLLHTGFVLLSRVSTSIYVDRYLLPFTFALVLFIAELLTQVRETKNIPQWRYYLVLAVLWPLALFWAPGPANFGLPMFDYTDWMLAELPGGLPVVDTDPATFVDVEYYHHGYIGRPFLFPLDDEITRDLGNPGGVSGFHEMDNFARFGIDAPDLQPTGEILGKYSDFVVVVWSDPTTWFRRRIQSSPEYAVTDLGAHNRGVVTLHFWRVHKVSADAAPSTGHSLE